MIHSDMDTLSTTHPHIHMQAHSHTYTHLYTHALTHTDIHVHVRIRQSSTFIQYYKKQSMWRKVVPIEKKTLLSHTRTQNAPANAPRPVFKFIHH